MTPSNCWIIVTATIALTLLRPTTAGFGDLLSSVINTCQYSACDNHPRCAIGYDALSQTREGKDFSLPVISLPFKLFVCLQVVRDLRKKYIVAHLERDRNASSLVAIKKRRVQEIIVNWIVPKTDVLDFRSKLIAAKLQICQIVLT